MNRAYYANPKPSFRQVGEWFDSECERSVREALDARDERLRDRVASVCMNSHAIIREHLRSETGLKLSQADKRQAVPVEVIDGIPVEFQIIIHQYPPIIWRLYQNKKILDDTVGGLGLIKMGLGEVLSFMGQQQNGIGVSLDTTLGFLSLLQKKLSELKLVEEIRSINMDILGAYYFAVPVITIHWMVIGIVAGILDVDVEDLTYVVLAHELAHAFTHRGGDIDGIQWDTKEFQKVELPIVEGLAQFYTEQICRKNEARRPGYLQTYEKLLSMQPDAYREYRDWVENHQAEVIRFGMIRARTTKIFQSEQFRNELQGIEEQIRVASPSRLFVL